jgi:hypothetical protein
MTDVMIDECCVPGNWVVARHARFSFYLLVVALAVLE